jgi:DNA topoisomerase-6 subunit B
MAGKTAEKSAKKPRAKKPPRKSRPPAPKTIERKKAPGPVEPPPKNGEPVYETAETMAAAQRDISVSEFFAKNRHLLGFDNPRKALLTCIKEAVDNSLDACEEPGILPEVDVEIKQLSDDRFRFTVRDNGPGIVKEQIPNIFGKLLYGSKFHRLRMSRGQQGIGISAAGMYGLLTTGQSMQITSRTGRRRPAHYYEIQIDTKRNLPEIIKDEEVAWERHHGTVVTIELEGKYQKGRQSVDEYLEQTAVANPHVSLSATGPDGVIVKFDRVTGQLPPQPRTIKPHPHGVELGVLIKMLRDTKSRTLKGFLGEEFSRVSSNVAGRICDEAKLFVRARPSRIARNEADALYAAIQRVKIMNPSTDCLSPIGEEQIVKGLRNVIEADFYAAVTRPPSVYRGNPFQVEVGIAYGGPKLLPEELVRVLRFANRVPLLYQQSACAIYRAILATNWKSYGMSQAKGALPTGPAAVMVHLASVWVPFTSESKEAIAHYPEIIKEIKLALQEAGRRLSTFVNRRRRELDERKKRGYIELYMPAIAEALKDILGLKEGQTKLISTRLRQVLEKTRTVKIESERILGPSGQRATGRAGNAPEEDEEASEPADSASKPAAKADRK